MEGGDTSGARRSYRAGELAALAIRFLTLTGPIVVYVASAPSVSPRANLLVAVAAAAALVHTVATLVLLLRVVRSGFLPILGVLLDAASITVFLGVALAGGGGVLAGAAALAYALVMVGSLVRLESAVAVAASAACAVGSLCVVIPLVVRTWGSDPTPWVLVPLGCLLLGAATTATALATGKTLRRTVATDALERATRRLRMTMEIVQVSIARLGQFVADLEKVSANLSEGARNQAASIDRITSSIGALNASQEQIYRSAEISAKTIRNTVDTADTGNQVVKRVIEEIHSISDTVDRMVSSLELIDNIADNTNLLALNANIEANRAGTGSMGFSVVADEIRNLAEQSQESAVEVGRLVKQIAKVIFTADTSSRNAGEIFDRINRDLSGYAEYVNGLHLSVQEQLKANREVQRSITRINEVTLNNTQAADRVRDVVGALEKEVTKLRALMDGKSTERARLS